MEHESQLKKLSNIVEEIKTLLTKKQILELISMVEENSEVTVSSIMDGLIISQSNAKLIKKQIDQLIIDGQLTAILLSLYQYANAEDDSHIYIYTTGGYGDDTTRLTSPALYELIISAERSIVLVSYDIRTNAGKLLECLEEASSNGVKLIFMIDQLENKKDFTEWVKKLPYPPELYSRVEDIGDKKSSLHVKCIVVDEKTAMFGSANLTYHGMKGNVEMGLILDDKRAIRSIIDILNNLKKDLKKIDVESL